MVRDLASRFRGNPEKMMLPLIFLYLALEMGVLVNYQFNKDASHPYAQKHD